MPFDYDEDDRYVFPEKLIARSTEQERLFRQLYNYDRIDFVGIQGFTTRDAERLVEDVLTVRSQKFPEVVELLNTVYQERHWARDRDDYERSTEYKLALIVSALFPNVGHPLA